MPWCECSQETAVVAQHRNVEHPASYQMPWQEKKEVRLSICLFFKFFSIVLSLGMGKMCLL